MMRNTVTLLLLFAVAPPSPADEFLHLAPFNAPATPPIGSPVAYAPTRSIVDPLYARGVVLLPEGQKPVVLCAVDWIGIANGGQDAWKQALAEAAGTTPDRVAVHTLHQHDAPNCDFAADALLKEQGLSGKMFSPEFARETIEKTAAAIRESLNKPRPVTHISTGLAKVEKVASNRRILGEDGKVKVIRWSSTKDPEAIAAPEGVIDPYVRLVSFLDGDEPLCALTYYACHPQSYYGKGDVTSDFPGIARTLFEKNVLQETASRTSSTNTALAIHFNGAGGNVTAGKYNDGSPELRPILAGRLADGMTGAWEASTAGEKHAIAADDVEWRVVPVKLPLAPHLVADDLRKQIADAGQNEAARLEAASNLAWAERAETRDIDLACLRIGDVYILHMPGELFVEYQLAAQKLRPKSFVCMAAYGDYGPGYIGTEAAYPQGGYETSARVSRVSPRVEQVLMQGMEELLK